ncbi:TPA: hypothetical protein DEP34_02155 [Candidatus Uhrbacteria bacterium]|uniref:Serine/threonine protein kinase n=2 Tax=Candidatus Uhriibacteriota TaxID=1752732 RepID=A0A0G1Q7S0_9BACT|nr:MAG: Serine/threonine protein kinase [Candidatus Uhrbacteria bacterium GW2011_GWF2_46_218]KKU40902.1 MAG: Serine/threonine protein kinase [Candidatus Uhrbacteria bacterium GW2011_GWE2_46_68]HBK33964.1 hypothetical protein [Candidatus Uhrbacteria bacterium]HCB19165.1 hypothetical protein [Candidatus Uhrbacteria bacterium]
MDSVLHGIGLLEPQTDGRFRPIHELGEGAMGSVWLVRDNTLGVDRAVKILKAIIARSPVLCSRFLREARTMASLKHAHVVTVYDYGKIKDATVGGEELYLPYIIMEFIEGGSLEEYLDLVGGPLPPRFAITEILRPILKALDVVHKAEIVHRDVKPANFLIDHGVIKLGDFGIAHAEIENATKGLTSDRDVLGTLIYMAPEQYLRSAKADARSDLYATGMILWQALRGEKPEMPLLGTRLAQDVQLMEGIHEALHPVLFRVMRAKPEDRFETAEEFLQTLEDALPLLPEDPPDVLPLTAYEKKKKEGDHSPAIVEEPVVPEDPDRPGMTIVAPEEMGDISAGSNTFLGLDEKEKSLTVMERRAGRSLLLRRGIAGAIVLSLAVAGGISWWLFSQPVGVPLDPVEAITEESVAVPDPVVEIKVPDPPPVVEEPIVKTESKTKSKVVKTIAPVEPDPLPQTPVKVSVGVDGDAKGVWISAGDASHALPAEVLPGTYTIEAQFDGERMVAGSVTITEGASATIVCQSTFAKCKKK